MNKNFSGCNLQGCSFRNKDLTNANFSYTNLQGVDFTGADLRGANFSYAITGIKPEWRSILYILLFGLASLSGYFSGLINYLISTIGFTSIQQQIFLFFLVIGFTFLAFTRIKIALYLQCFCLTLLLVFNILFTTAFSSINWFNSDPLIDLSIPDQVINLFNTYWEVSTIFIQALALIGAFLWSIILTIFTSVIVIISNQVGRLFSLVIFVSISLIITNAVSGYASLLIILVLITQSLVINSFLGNSKYSYFKTLHNIAICLTTFRIGNFCTSTSFYKANLQGANFTGAILSQSNFQKANLTHVCWFNARELQNTSIQGTMLDHPRILDLLVTKKAPYGRLAGLNLYGANLNNADLRGADLSDVSLHNAQLKNADLRDAKLLRTNFRNALGLETAQVSGTILESPEVRQLLVIKSAKGLNLSGLNLQGVNLDNADLQSSVLQSTNLYLASLKGANLRYSSLKNTNLRKADLRGAKLEGVEIDRTDLRDAKMSLADFTRLTLTGKLPLVS